MTTAENAANPPHYLDLYAMTRPDALALIQGERTLTYAQFNARARRVANALIASGTRPNDRIAVMAHNCIELLEITAGLAKLGALPVLLNYRLREHEVAYILNDCGASVAIAGPDLVEVVEKARGEVNGQVTYVAIGSERPAGWLDYEELLAGASEELPTTEGGLGSSISYTSGTTGKPKGAYRPRALEPSEVLPVIQEFGLLQQDVHLLAGPYYHSAPNAFVGLHLLLGSTIVIMPKYEALEALRLIDSHKVTTTFMAPTLLQRLVDVPEEEFARYDTSSLRAIILGGAPCPYVLKERAIKRFGEVLWEFYGATETAFVTILRPEDQLRKHGSCGKVGPGQEIRLLDENGAEVPDGTPGEMWSRVAYLAQYYNKPEATARSMKDGFFSVGDIAYRDSEGYYYICDRKIDMIISGGVNIYPAEIEAVLTAHPAVADVAVIGVPDSHWGEAVKAVVQLRPGFTASADELIAFCGAQLADYKRPRSVDFVAELPRNPAGKLLKAQIRAPYWADAGRKI
ncbi:MAG TPA: AMP-binding protein [Ktedonobacteraceae bacterium]|nr:AMP-binding protein [Ktedonobacteraceae bacterium]